MSRIKIVNVESNFRHKFSFDICWKFHVTKLYTILSTTTVIEVLFVNSTSILSGTYIKTLTNVPNKANVIKQQCPSVVVLSSATKRIATMLMFYMYGA